MEMEPCLIRIKISSRCIRYMNSQKTLRRVHLNFNSFNKVKMLIKILFQKIKNNILSMSKWKTLWLLKRLNFTLTKCYRLTNYLKNNLKCKFQTLIKFYNKILMIKSNLLLLSVLACLLMRTKSWLRINNKMLYRINLIT